MTALDAISDATTAREGARAAYQQRDAVWRWAIRLAAKDGYSQTDIAEAAGITQGRVAQIVAGRR